MTLKDLDQLSTVEDDILYPKSIPISLKGFYKDYYNNGCVDWYELENYSGNKVSDVFEILCKGPNILSFLKGELFHWLREVEKDDDIPNFILQEFPNLDYYDYYDEDCAYVNERFEIVLKGWLDRDRDVILLIECYEVVRYLETERNIVFDDKETFKIK